tara:strand:+ start:11123 stop:11395 length:273 start_codon:yes stop_codon:yes gene_type:complete
MYDDIQLGNQEAQMGDLFNGKWLMVNEYHLAEVKPKALERMRLWVVKYLNTSTQEQFTVKYLAEEMVREAAHLEPLSVTITIPEWCDVTE